MKRITAFVIAFLLLLCGCDKTAAQTEEKEILDVFSQIDSDSVPSAYPIYINDTEINGTPEKVVCLSQTMADIVSEMGYGGTIVGIGSYCSVPEGADTPADVGRPTQPDIEKIIGLSPDILLTSTAIPNKDVMELSDSGICTVLIPYPRSVDEFRRLYTAVGLIYRGMFDGEEAGYKAFEPISAAFDKAASLDCGAFVYITEGLAAAGEQTLENSVLSLFGTSAASLGGVAGYSSELGFLTDAQPDVIFLNSVYKPEDIAADEILGGLGAVSGGRVISIDNSYFENPSKNIVSLIQDITDKLSDITNERGAE